MSRSRRATSRRWFPTRPEFRLAGSRRGLTFAPVRWIAAGPRVSTCKRVKETNGQGDENKMGSGTHGHRVVDGSARHAGRVDGAQHDPAAPARVHRATRVDGERL